MNKKGCLCLLGFVFAFNCQLLSQQTNVALHKPVTVTSAARQYPASNIVDGIISRTSKWEAANGNAPHIVEIDLKKYYDVSEVKVHTGIRDDEKMAGEMTQAAGFWSAKNFKLQYWDDANWSDLPKSEVHENRLTAVVFDYTPAVTTFRIRLVCDDGEPINIMEIEVFGAEASNMPEPPSLQSSVEPQIIFERPQSASITVINKIVGKSLKYVGYNQGYYMPGNNTSAWVEYSGVNAFRVWATLNSFVPESAVQVDKTIMSVAEFDKRKAELRSSPENNVYIKWNALLPLYDLPDSSSTNAMVYNYALSELKRLNVEVILQMGSTDFNETWENKWKQWQRYYALAYHSAQVGEVAMFAMQNEPNHRNSGPMKLDQWISGMQIVSDAIHCAVEDVNKKYGKKLVPKFVGPVTAGNNPEWWSAIAKSIRTDYHGNKIDHDLLEIFSTHSYNSPAAGYENRIENIRKIIKENHPAGHDLPIVYTEIGRWMNAYLIDKEETMDSPSLFTEWAGIYSNNMKNNGYGMLAFKFANTSSSTYPEGIKSGHHFVWHGQRIVEDAYKNVAAGKKARTSNAVNETLLITDGDKSDASTWISDSVSATKWVEIDLGKSYGLGSAIVYTGDASGVYTSPSRIRNFKLQYLSEKEWKDIPGTTQKDNKYAQLFIAFVKPVYTTKVRFVSNDPGSLRIREIKLFEEGDGPSPKADYSISGILRTGEVVRLFAKGFKNERPLLQTKSSVNDTGLDSYTSYDEKTGNYYMWLVQRGLFDYKLTINFKDLNLPNGTLVTAETVNPLYYGEVTNVLVLDVKKQLQLTLTPQTVVLLTISKKSLARTVVKASGTATVSGGSNAFKNYRDQKFLSVQLNAAEKEKNQVAYISFHLPEKAENLSRVLLKVNGSTDKKEAPFRLHVYAIPGVKWNAQTINWNNAPLLDKEEALVSEVGTKAFVAGELTFNPTASDHFLDVTELVKKHASGDISFVMVRETRQLGDDEDKNKKVTIISSGNAPQLVYWKTK